jgi:hypothetical protein
MSTQHPFINKPNLESAGKLFILSKIIYLIFIINLKF